MSDIKQVLVEHNEQIQKFCREHNLDVSTHFNVLASEAHPVAKSASRKFRILAEPMLQFDYPSHPSCRLTTREQN